MRKQEAIALISDLRHGNTISFTRLMEYVSRIDKHSQKKWTRTLQKMLSKQPNAYADILIALLRDGCKEEQKLHGIVNIENIKKKEYHEARYFYEQVMQGLDMRNGFSHVYDLCCGNGLAGFFFLSNGMARNVGFYDKEKNRAFRKVEKYFAGNAADYSHNICDLFMSSPTIEEDSMIISIHPCGELTDIVIDIALEARKPFAVMPCCHNYSNNRYFSSELIYYFSNKDDAIDAARVRKIMENGYDIMMRKIPEEITEKNRIIIGIPR